MTDASIQSNRLSNKLPSGATNGQIPVWNSATNRWDAGSNAPFDPTANITFSGNNIFSGTVTLENTTTIRPDFFNFNTGGGNDLTFNINNIGAGAIAIFPNTWTSNSFAAQDLNNNFSVAQTFQSSITAQIVSINGSAGNGYLSLLKQTTYPSGHTNTISVFSDASNRLAWKSSTGYTRTFDATENTANRVYNLPDADTTLAGLSVAQTFTKQQTINISDSSTFTDFIINATTKTGNNLVDFKVNGSSRWSCSNIGVVNNPVLVLSSSLYVPIIKDLSGVTLMTLAATSLTISATTILITAATTNTQAGFRLPAGSAPAAPVNGDMWLGTDDRLQIRVNGVTKTVTLT